MAFAVFGMAGLMAQTETKKCTKAESAKCCAKKASASTAISADNTQVLGVAMKRQNVTKRQCAETGAVSYFQKEVCEKSGKVSYNEVEFDAEQNQFVNKSPNDIGDANQGNVYKMANTEAANTADVKTKKACSKKEGVKCCASKKKAEGTK